MKRNGSSWLLLLGLGVVGLPSAAFAQGQKPGNSDNTAYGTTAAEFLLLGGGARGVALGPSYSAQASDASALYYNPAGAALGTRPSIVVGTYDYIADTRYSWGGIAFPFDGASKVFGVQLGTFGFKDQPVYTVEQPDGTGETYSVNQTFVGLTYGQRFSDRFSAGVTAKGVFDQLGTVSGRAFAIDFGTDFHAQLNGHPIRLGFTLQNLGTTMSYNGGDLNRSLPRDTSTVSGEPIPVQLKTKGFSLPTIFQVALAYDVFSAANKNNRVTVIGSFNQANNNRAGFGFAGEWTLRNLGGSGFGAALRGSYSWAPANNDNVAGTTVPTAMNDEENFQGAAGGGGLFYDTGNFLLGADYAFKYMGVLGPTHFVSFSLGW